MLVCALRLAVAVYSCEFTITGSSSFMVVAKIVMRLIKGEYIGNEDSFEAFR